MQNYLSINRIADKFSVSRATVYKWRAEKGFPKAFTLHGAKLFFLEKEVEEWAKKNIKRAA